MALSKKDKLRLLTILLESRHGDLREQSLNRQGKGHFHVSGMGHEALAAISIATEPGDYICGYYRDRALVLGRGVSFRRSWRSIISRNAKVKATDGRCHRITAMPNNIWSVPTPTGSQLLPACGIAWGIKLDDKPNFVIATIGDAATRQGDFFEAVCFAKEKQLPVLFSSRTTATASAARRDRSTRWRSMFFSLTTGGRSTGAMSGRSTKPVRKRSRISGRAKDRSFSG